MRYGEPSIETCLLRLVKAGHKKITLAPLYPQFADSTTTTVIEEARRVLREKKLDVQLSILQPFYDQPEYIEALAASARPHLQQDYDHLLLSFHGLPERHPEQTRPDGQSLPQGRRLLPDRLAGGIGDLLSRAVFPHRRRLRQKHGAGGRQMVGVVSVAPGPGEMDRAVHRSAAG